MNKLGFVYIMTNKNKTTLYIGVTNDLCRRIYEHCNHLIKNSFTDKYNLEYCIYYEEFPYFDLAIKREKELKKWNRQKKEDLINKNNPEWKELVTEKGFIRKTIPFSQQVNDLINELQQNEQIPPVFPQNENCHSEQSEETKQIPPYGRNDNAQSVNKEIPPVGRNDSSPGEEISEGSGSFAATSFTPSFNNGAVISSEARNLSSQSAEVISSEARNLNEKQKSNR